MILDDISQFDVVTGEGFAEGKVLEADGNEALIELPDGELIVRAISAISRPPVPVARPAEQKLICAHGGHTWSREPQRGKPPKFCPKHAPAKKKAAERRTVAPKTVQTDGEQPKQKLHCEAGDHDWYREPKRGKPPVNCPEHAVASTTRTVNVPVIDLDSFGEIGYEDQLKLNYIKRELERGRDHNDANMLLQTRGDIIRRLTHRQAVAV